MYKAVISPSASADLLNALRYIACELGNPLAASRLADAVDRCYADLEEMPAAHELCRTPVLRRTRCRCCAVGNYLGICRLVEKPCEVRVVHVFHALQDYFAAQKGEP